MQAQILRTPYQQIFIPRDLSNHAYLQTGLETFFKYVLHGPISDFDVVDQQFAFCAP